MDMKETQDIIDETEKELRASMNETLEDIAIETGTFAVGTLAAATGDFPALGGFDGIRERIKLGIAYLRHKYQEVKDTLNDEEKMRPFRDEALGLFMIQGVAYALTGDSSLGVAVLPDFAATGARDLTYRVKDAINYISALDSLPPGDKGGDIVKTILGPKK